MTTTLYKSHQKQKSPKNQNLKMTFNSSTIWSVSSCRLQKLICYLYYADTSTKSFKICYVRKETKCLSTSSLDRKDKSLMDWWSTSITTHLRLFWLNLCKSKSNLKITPKSPAKVGYVLQWRLRRWKSGWWCWGSRNFKSLTSAYERYPCQKRKASDHVASGLPVE